ncbi:unnamed protein product [Chironomus riparius]|uniref:Mitochondrial transcription rescue factor 1 C-terminal domain-containing protein n=1 Tax=Chironomus riparius TaxID=315576 RepID=A0A9N9S0B6_9DIPT|nr:unnamed protein product [Chironomus riparius]
MALKNFSRFSQLYFNSILRSSSITSNALSRSFITLTINNKSYPALKNGTNSISLVCEQKRYKYDKKGSTKQSAEVDSDDELSEFDDVDKQKIAKIKVQSLRADLLLKVALGIARNKIEASFYEGKIRLNGKKLSKKSVHCNEGDVLDIIKGDSPTNSEHFVIGRLEILSVETDGEEFIYLTVKRFKSLTVEKEEFKHHQ